MFDLSLYEEVRERYGAARAFPHLYDKIRPEVDVLAVLDEEAAWPDGVDAAGQHVDQESAHPVSRRAQSTSAPMRESTA